MCCCRPRDIRLTGSQQPARLPGRRRAHEGLLVAFGFCTLTTTFPITLGAGDVAGFSAPARAAGGSAAQAVSACSWEQGQVYRHRPWRRSKIRLRLRFDFRFFHLRLHGRGLGPGRRCYRDRGFCRRSRNDGGWRGKRTRRSRLGFNRRVLPGSIRRMAGRAVPGFRLHRDAVKYGGHLFL